MSENSLDKVVQFSHGKCIVAFLKEGKRCATDEFLDMLQNRYPAAYLDVMKTLERLSEKGDVRTTDKIKPVGKGVWQVSSNKPPVPRLYGFTTNFGEHIVTHGTSKVKKQATLHKEYEQTRRYKDRWEKEHP